MGSDKKKDAASEEAARLKKEKKEKKEKKRSEKDGVSKPKKEKKDKKSKERLERALDEHLQASAAASVPPEALSEDEDKPAVGAVVVSKQQVPKGSLVSFALPLADDKVHKKVYKTVKKATKKHALLRGVKEVNKALRKAPTKTASTTSIPGVVIIAGDISPAEVIMHLPVYCEERNVPYLFVGSRAELGAAAKTKRPTSVVMLLPQGRKKDAAAGKKKEKEAVEEEDEGEDDYPKAWQDLASTAQKEFGKQLKGLL